MHNIKQTVFPPYVGVDEVGRGALAGPVVACAMLLSGDAKLLPCGVQDSKKIPKRKRMILYEQLIASYEYALGIASVEEIEELNILEATKLAMLRAVQQIKGRYNSVLFDGNCDPMQENGVSQYIIGGDDLIPAISAASIIAKEYRDNVIMLQLDKEHPIYNWRQNAGYGTKQHREKIVKYGVTLHHRSSFLKKILLCD